MKKRSGVPPMRGVGAFLSNLSETDESVSESTVESPTSIAIEEICLPVKQPRRFFDPEKLEQLAASIQQHGILEPVLVRSLPQGQYELVAGERRYRAAQLAGLKEIPVVVRELTDQEALQLALIENLQREDLNPVEETEGMLDLLTLKLECSQEDIFDALAQMATAQKKGVELSGNVSRQVETIAAILGSTISLTPESFRTSRLPLLKLPADVLEALRQGKLEYTKARAIARLKDPQRQQMLLGQVIEEGLTLSQIRAEVTAANHEMKTNQSPVLKQEFDQTYGRLKKSEIWRDRTKQKRLKKLLAEMESLLEEK